jgi:hypothetical protein
VKQTSDYIKEYSKLKDLNQKIKLDADIYYIASSGIIFLKSSVPYIEKLAILHGDFPILMYSGLIINPSILFEFTKDAKKSKIICTNTENKLYYGQNDNSDIHVEINRLCNISCNEEDKDKIQAEKNHEQQILNETIFPQCYTRMIEIYQTINDSTDEYPLSTDQIESICDGNIIYFECNDFNFTIAKELFPSIKKTDSLAIRKLYYKNKDNPNKDYFLFKEDSDILTIYTLIAQVTF